MNIKEKQKAIADKFTILTGIYTTYCEPCEMWVVHCPACLHNWCVVDCGCGFAMLLDKKQAQLDKMLLTLEGEK